MPDQVREAVNLVLDKYMSSPRRLRVGIADEVLIAMREQAIEEMVARAWMAATKTKWGGDGFDGAKAMILAALTPEGK